MSEDILKKVKLPSDLKKLSIAELNILCGEIRENIIDTVSKNGGHLSSNLGVVELTVAMHRVFNCPKDTFVWDVGHQCYAHKILTGRLDKLNTIRKKDGLSGFPNRNESKFDTFTTGHSSTSISSALGIARAKSILGDISKTVAVIGDGALSGGLAYEGMNNVSSFKKNFVVILNDNKMSISRNVGSMARYLSAMRMRKSYLKLKNIIANILSHMPVLGKFFWKVINWSTSAIKQLLYNGNIFESMGFVYYGPVDGHDIKKLINVLTVIKNVDRPVLLHINTVKGKGYSFAEKNPKGFHGTSSFNVKTGGQKASDNSFSSVFSEEICKIAEKDKRICAITAAMTSGTGLEGFSKKYKERFFDVGIAEGHAITFASGLAQKGLIPIFAVYSTFLQRGYDQIIHDIALQNLKMILAIDRAGIVGEDGETHQGIFDTAFLNSIPGITIFAPSFFDELRSMLNEAVYNVKGPCVIRYPKGKELYCPKNFKLSGKTFDIYGEKYCDIAVVTYGRTVSQAFIAKEELEKIGVNICVIKLNIIKPIDNEAVNIASNFKKVFFFEEGILNGGIGEHFNYLLSRCKFNGKFKLISIDNEFVPHSTVNEALSKLNLDSEKIKNIILRSVENFGR